MQEKKKSFIKRFIKKLKDLLEILKKILLKYRKLFLVIFAILGLVIAFLLFKYSLFEKFTSCVFGIEDKNLRLYYTIFITISALPVSFYLWALRNHDKLQQLKKSQESNNFNNFSNAIKLFTEKDNLDANAVGLKLLMKLKHQGLFVKEIDLVTPYKNLKNAILRMANLSKVNLEGARLGRADLSRANLEGLILH